MYFNYAPEHFRYRITKLTQKPQFTASAITSFFLTNIFVNNSCKTQRLGRLLVFLFNHVYKSRA